MCFIYTLAESIPVNGGSYAFVQAYISDGNSISKIIPNCSTQNYGI